MFWLKIKSILTILTNLLLVGRNAGLWSEGNSPVDAKKVDPKVK